MTTGAIESPGCLILLIDESAAMQSAVQEEQLELGKEKSKGTTAANVINSLLKQLSNGPDFDIALIGYRSDDTGASIARSRWSGPLSGRDFISSLELAANPVAIETRQRRIPDPSSFDGFRSEPVEVPVWYVPEASGIAPQVLAFETCRELLTKWGETAGPNPGQPLVMHLFAGGSGDGNPSRVIGELQEMSIRGRKPLVFNAHFSNAKAVPPTVYCSNRSFLAPGPGRDLFERSSQMTGEQINALKSAKIVVASNARGMLLNGKVLDIVRFLSLAKTHVQNWPPRQAPAVAAVEEPLPAMETAITSSPQPEPSVSVPSVATADDAAPPVETLPEPIPLDAGGDVTLTDNISDLERAALLVFVLDRSVNDPFAADPNNPFLRLQGQANDWLGKLAKKPTGQIEVAVVSYGVDSTGEMEVRNTFEAGLTGRTTVTDSELESGTIRVIESEQQFPNGIGGLMTVPVKQLILIELDPTAAATPGAAFETVASLVGDWCKQHPNACVPPVVLHMTRGSHPAGDLDPGVEAVRANSVASGSTVVYHSIATEAPHTSLSYCESDDGLETAELKVAFAASSALLGREQLMESKPALVKAQSRGIVVNGKFDLLLDGIRAALTVE